MLSFFAAKLLPRAARCTARAAACVAAMAWAGCADAIETAPPVSNAIKTSTSGNTSTTGAEHAGAEKPEMADTSVTVGPQVFVPDSSCEQIAAAQQRYAAADVTQDHDVQQALADAQAIAQQEDSFLNQLLATVGEGHPHAADLAHAWPDAMAQTLTLVPGPKDICIVTHRTASIDAYAQYSLGNQSAYARRHGYKMFQYKGFFGGTRYMNATTEFRPARFGLFWEKILAVRDAQHQTDRVDGSPLCSWLMWVDADTLFTNPTRSIETVIAPWTQSQTPRQIILARDDTNAPGRYINAGVMFIKNDAVGRAFVDDTLALFDQLRGDVGRFHLGDQDAIECILFGVSPQDHPSLPWDQLRDPHHPHIGLAPTRLFNAYSPRHDWTNLPRAMWVQGDFLAHFAGRAPADRIFHMRRMAQDVKDATDAQSQTP